MTRRRNGTPGADPPHTDHADYVAAQCDGAVNAVFAVALDLHRDINLTANAETARRLRHQLALLNEAIQWIQAIAMHTVAGTSRRDAADRRLIADHVRTAQGVR